MGWVFRILVVLSVLLGLTTAGVWIAAPWFQVAAAYATVSGRELSLTTEGDHVSFHYQFEGTLLRQMIGKSPTGLIASINRRYQSVEVDTPNFPLLSTAPSTTQPTDSSSAIGSSYTFTVVIERRTYLGFSWEGNTSQAFLGPSYALRVPYWFFLLVASILPLLAFRHHRRQRRRLKKGLCLVCGYDLRSSPDRCPECGTATVQSPA